MKILILLARIVLGLIMFVFGLNGFLNFLHGPVPGGSAGVFLGVVIATHYVYLISGTQVVAGAFLLVNRFVVLALALLAAVIANILTFHLTMLPKGSQLAIVVAILWAFLAFKYRAHFAVLFVSRAEPK